MKRYGKRFWKVTDFLIVYIVVIGILIIDPKILFSEKHYGIGIMLVIMAYHILPFLVCARAFNYIVVTDDILIIKNDIYTFTKKMFALKDITEMDAKSESRGYFRITIEASGKKHSFHSQALTPAMMHELAGELRAKGIHVTLPDNAEKG